jgi:hypothetical protein
VVNPECRVGIAAVDPYACDVLLAGARSPPGAEPRRRGPGSGSASSGLVGVVEVA